MVFDDGSVISRQMGREKPGFDKYCIRPGVVKTTSKRGKIGRERSVGPMKLTSPFSSMLACQALDSATMKN